MPTYTSAPPVPAAEPYVLINSGGHVEGQRPRTKLAFVVKAFPDGSALIAVRTRSGWAKHTRAIKAGDIVTRWAAMPTPAQIRQFRLYMR